jgi:NAD(P)H-nitrite reductase large subunit
MAHVVIIGASCAGHTVAASVKQKKPGCSVTVVSQNAFLPCDKRRLLEYFSGKAREKDISLCAPDFYEKNNIRFLKETRVMGLNPVRKTVQLKHDEKRESIGYDIAVICTGMEVVVPEVIGSHKEGVFFFDSLKDFKAARSAVISDTVSLWGEWNERAKVLCRYFGAEKIEVKFIGERPADAADFPGVEFIASEIVELIGETGIQAIKFKEGKIIGTSLLVVTGPARPATGFLKETPVKLDGDGFVSLDEKLMSSCNDVYACGSVTGTAASSWDACAAQASLVADIVAAAV